jgi:hypothetical protein
VGNWFRQLAISFAAALLALPACAQERGTPVFQDAFDAKETFAENWVVGKEWNGRILSADGQVHFPRGGELRMRRDTPAEFHAEMDVTVNSPGDDNVPGNSFCGFSLEGFLFALTDKGRYWVARSPKESSGTGLTGPVEGFQFGKPVAVSLTRKAEPGAAKYVFRVNGKEAATRVFNLKQQPDGTYEPLRVFSYRVDMSIDNFGLFTVKGGADDSPNLVFNSGFEHALDGFPPYYSTPSFNLATITNIPYETFLDSVALDGVEKHSGRFSLKLVNDGRTGGGAQSIAPWGVGTVVGGAGVFSVWMKADHADFPVSLRYGGRPEVVKVGTEWARYETVNTNLPRPGVYSPVRISFKEPGTLWIDDLQAEFISPPAADELASGRTFATPYKPSALDRARFGSQPPATGRAPEIVVPRLPAGIDPAKGFDAWTPHAAMCDRFHNNEKPPKTRTEAYLACDERQVYVGFRCHVADLDAIDPQVDMVEFLAEPLVSGKKFMQFQFFVHADNTREDKGLGMDSAWEGRWTSVVTRNEQASSLDYTLAIPWSDFAHPEIKTRWIVNLHRYDSATKEVVTLIQSHYPSFANPQLWPFATFPEDLVAAQAIGVSGGEYSDAAVSLDIVNPVSSDRAVTVALTTDGRTATQEATLKPGANRVAVEVPLADPKVAVEILEGGERLSNQLCTLEKRDPVSMLGRLSFYMEEAEAPFRVETRVAAPETLAAVLSCGPVVAKRKAESKFTMSLPLRDIPEGEHRATLALVDPDGKTVAQTSAPLVKRAFKAGAAQVNHFSRSLMHDGKPVVPFAPFIVVLARYGMTTEQMDAHVELLRKHGFRFAHILFESDNPATMEKENALVRHFLDAADARGIKVILWSKYYDYTDEACEQTRLALDAPNVITQMVLDEPELGRASDWSRDFLRKMRAFFPYHPTQMNNTVLGIPARHGNLETDILMLDDYLTNTENRTVESVVQHADVMWRAGAAEGKPCWYFIVGNNTSLHYREPTYGEQIAQTYGNIAAGCTGFSLFYGWPGTHGNWKAYLQLNREILALTDVLTSEEETAPVSATGDPALMRHITRLHDGHLHVIACNIDAQDAGDVTFTLPTGLRVAGDADVLFEDRKAPVENGRFRDAFAGHARHVYRLKLAEPVQSHVVAFGSVTSDSRRCQVPSGRRKGIKAINATTEGKR